MSKINYSTKDILGNWITFENDLNEGKINSIGEFFESLGIMFWTMIKGFFIIGCVLAFFALIFYIIYLSC